MFAKSASVMALFAATTQLVAAQTPPACLLAAVNTQSEPYAIFTICNAERSFVVSEIKTLCGDQTDAAMAAFEQVCGGASSTGSMTPSASMTMTGGHEAMMTGSASMTPSTITYTSTSYDTVCDCTKTAEHTTTAMMGPSGVVSAMPTATGMTGEHMSAGAGSGAAPTNGGADAPFPSMGAGAGNGTVPMGNGAATGTGSAMPGSSSPVSYTGAAGRVEVSLFAGLAVSFAAVAGML